MKQDFAVTIFTMKEHKEVIRECSFLRKCLREYRKESCKWSFWNNGLRKGTDRRVEIFNLEEARSISTTESLSYIKKHFRCSCLSCGLIRSITEFSQSDQHAMSIHACYSTTVARLLATSHFSTSTFLNSLHRRMCTYSSPNMISRCDSGWE